MDSKQYLASALAENTTQTWIHHTSLEKAEPHFAKLKLLSSTREKSPPQDVSSSGFKVQGTYPSPLDQHIKANTVIREGCVAITSNDTMIRNTTAGPGSQGTIPDAEYTGKDMECFSKVNRAQCLVDELQSQQRMEQAVQAEARFMEVTSQQRTCIHNDDNDLPPPSVPETATLVNHPVESVHLEVLEELRDESLDPLVNGRDAHLSLSLVNELNVQQSLVQALEAETKYAEITTTSVDRNQTADVIENLPPPESSTPRLSETLLVKQVKSETKKGEKDTVVIVLKEQVYLAESLSTEHKSQQSMAQCCDAERKYIEVMSSSGKYTQSVESVLVNDDTCELDINLSVMEHGQRVDEVETTDGLEPVSEAPGMESEFGMESGQPSMEKLSFSPEVSLVLEVANDQSSVVTSEPALETHLSLIPVPTVDIGTNTDQGLTQTIGTNTDPPPTINEVGCNTSLSCFDILRRAKEMEEFEMLKAEHHVIVGQLNQQRSQRMVADQLVTIVQSDLSELRQKHVSDVTTRMRVENELGDAKVCVSMYVND